MEVLTHRIVWSFVVLALLKIAWQGDALRMMRSLKRSVVGLYALAGVLIAINWLIYIWAVNAGFIVETSLGYFIAPLVNVLLGVLVFRERLRMAQWTAVALAAVGVLYLTITYGSLPWIALGLAASFGSYGLVKKKGPLGSLEGLALETAILVPPAIVYLVALNESGRGSFPSAGASIDLLLIGGGTITIGPLLLFASAVQRVPLSVIGILQFIAPTIQFFLGVLMYGEPFTGAQLLGFSAVWAALVVFSLDGLLSRREQRRGAAGVGSLGVGT
jgi:chloramphenicol-sensitive protein RarD